MDFINTIDFLEADADEISYGGQLITITGSGFNLDKGLKISIQDKDCLNINLISNSQLQCRTPLLKTGISDLVLQQNDQQSNNILNATTSLIIKTKTITLSSFNITDLLIQQQDRINYIGNPSQIDLLVFGQNLIDTNYQNKPKVYLKSESLQTIYEGTFLGDIKSDQINVVQFRQIPYGRYLLEYMNDIVYSQNGNINLQEEIILMYGSSLFQQSSRQQTTASNISSRVLGY